MTPEAEAVKRRAEREQAARQQLAVATTESWANWIDARIREHLAEHDEIVTGSVGEVYAIERADRRRADEELTRKLEELQRADIVREAIAQERRDRDAAIVAAVAETRRTVEVETKAKLEELEHHLKSVDSLHDALAQERRDHEAAIVQERRDRETAIAAAVAETRQTVEAEMKTKLDELEHRLKSVPGKLPVAKVWCPETVVYQAEFVCHGGALYQARKDTAQTPGGTDWICVAYAGRDGVDGRDAVTPTVRETYDRHESYRQLDIVASDGAAFIARHDNPGTCPGPGWQLISKQGKTGRRGETGERGPKGEKGEPGLSPVVPRIINTTIDERYNLVIMRDDNSLETIPLRPAFERFYAEVSSQT